MARNSQRGAKNNNPEGRNQFSNGFIDGARDRPVAAAAAAAAAVGAGVFLWSRRNQISDQISNLSDQVSEWAGGQQFAGSQTGDNTGDFEFAEADTSSATASSSPSRTRSGGKRGKGSGQGFSGSTGTSGDATTAGSGTTSGGSDF
ncbi:MAG: hypothetical protein M3428_05460 [Pseudomonadota bacterium]|jgi:hypothetical protein|nr:hypothetical protein [Pseudomonadota bacterium]